MICSISSEISVDYVFVDFFFLFWMFSGCCFLICPSREEADKAVSACHNKKTLPGVSFELLFSSDL